MSSERLTRAYATDLEIRGGDGRTISGIAVPFETPARINEWPPYWEVVARGAFERTIAERGAEKVKLLSQHNLDNQGRNPIGRATMLREDAAGLYGEFRVSKTPLGDETLELIRDGTLDSFSIGFRSLRDRWNRDSTVREQLEIALHEVSVVSAPAYEDAAILAVRSANPTPLLDAAHRRLELQKRAPASWTTQPI